MAYLRINLKNIDFFKFKKLIIDGNRDDYNNCSKEVKLLCDYVQTLNFRDEEFDDEHDRSRFTDICSYYKQIISGSRIQPIDIRIKSGWWGDSKNAYAAGTVKPQVLRENLVTKAREWARRLGKPDQYVETLGDKIDGPGLFIFKHKDHQCFQYVGRAEKVFAKCGETLKAAYEGAIEEPLAALLIISLATDWEFYFIPVQNTDDERMLRILENDLVLKHDSIWPYGLNFQLHVNTLMEVSEFRKSCQRHHWPPEDTSESNDASDIDIQALRRRIHTGQPGDLSSLDLGSPVVERSPSGHSLSSTTTTSSSEKSDKTRPVSGNTRPKPSPTQSPSRTKSASVTKITPKCSPAGAVPKTKVTPRRTSKLPADKPPLDKQTTQPGKQAVPGKVPSSSEKSKRKEPQTTADLPEETSTSTSAGTRRGSFTLDQPTVLNLNEDISVSVSSDSVNSFTVKSLTDTSDDLDPELSDVKLLNYRRATDDDLDCETPDVTEVENASPKKRSYRSRALELKNAGFTENVLS